MLKIEIAAQQNPNRKVPFTRHEDRNLAEIIENHKEYLGFRPIRSDYSELLAMEQVVRRWIWDHQCRWGNIRIDEQWLAEQVTTLREADPIHCLDSLLGLCLCGWLEFHQVGESGYDLAGLVRTENEPPLPHEYASVPAITGPFHVVAWDTPPPATTALKCQIEAVVTAFEARLTAGALPKTVLFELLPKLHKAYREALHHTMSDREVRFNTKPLSLAFSRIDEGRSDCVERPHFAPKIHEGLWVFAFLTYAFHKGNVVEEMLEASEIDPRKARKLR